jgi:hypothetical protein
MTSVFNWSRRELENKEPIMSRKSIFHRSLPWKSPFHPAPLHAGISPKKHCNREKTSLDYERSDLVPPIPPQTEANTAMKLTPLRTTLITVLSALALTTGAARLHAEQVEMNMAIEQLEKAKHDENHIEHLEKAKFHLEEARHNKHGERVEAMRQIDMAIGDAKAHEFRRMEEHIDHAIHDVREGKQ